MIQPNQFYRRYRVIEESFDANSNIIKSFKRTLNIGDIATFSEFEYDTINDREKRCQIEFNIPIRPIIVRISFDELDEVFTAYHKSIGTLDDRSQKKKLSYRGPMTMYFSIDKNVMSSVGYPEGYDFLNKAPDVIFDAMLCNFITPFN